MIVSCLFLERGRDLGTEKRKENRINRLFFFWGGGGWGGVVYLTRNNKQEVKGVV